jgi:hypothetical protein
MAVGVQRTCGAAVVGRGCRGHAARRSSAGDGERSPPAVNAFRAKRFELRTSSDSILVQESRGVGSWPRPRLVPPQVRTCFAYPFIYVMAQTRRCIGSSFHWRSERYPLKVRGERSTALVNNVNFEKWGDYLGDPALPLEFLDRATIMKMNGRSYRAHRAEQASPGKWPKR